MAIESDQFYRISKLPPYVFAVINEMKAKARAAQLDVVDLGMGNPDGATPRAIVSKLVEASRNQRLLERFHGEVRVARLVSHPNVCRVYDIGEIEGMPFISMEYVDGEDLASLLLRIGRLPADKAVET